MTPNQLPPLSDEQMDSIFADWLDAACLIHQEGSDTIEPAPQTHLHKNDVVQLMRVVESATLAALAQQAQEPVAWLYVDTVGERYLCFSRPTGGGAITNLYATPPAPQPAPDIDEAAIARMTKRGADAWAGVDAQSVRGGEQVPAPVDEREAFERWCGPFSELRRSDFDPGRYCHSGVSLAWDAWQARAALQSPAPQTKVQP